MNRAFDRFQGQGDVLLKNNNATPPPTENTTNEG